MKLVLLWVGRTRDGNIRASVDRYIDRIHRHIPVAVFEVKEESAGDRHAEAEAILREGRRIRERIPRDHETILLDAAGREMSSEEFARFLGEKIGSSSSAVRGVTFIIGGHLGVDEETKRLADHTIALSRMTLTHEMARLVAVEQIYRGLSILQGARYHR